MPEILFSEVKKNKTEVDLGTDPGVPSLGFERSSDVGG